MSFSKTDLVTKMCSEYLKPKHPVWRLEYICNIVNFDSDGDMDLVSEKISRIYEVVDSDVCKCEIRNLKKSKCSTDFKNKILERLADEDGAVFYFTSLECWYLLSFTQLA